MIEQLLATDLPHSGLIIIAGVVIIERVLGVFSARLQARESTARALIEQLADHDEIIISIRRKKRE